MTHTLVNSIFKQYTYYRDVMKIRGKLGKKGGKHHTLPGKIFFVT
jgi:hypothetical protein